MLEEKSNVLHTLYRLKLTFTGLKNVAVSRPAAFPERDSTRSALIANSHMLTSVAQSMQVSHQDLFVVPPPPLLFPQSGPVHR